MLVGVFLKIYFRYYILHQPNLLSFLYCLLSQIKHHHHHVAVPVPIPPPYDPHYHDSPHYHSSPPGATIDTGVELDHPPPGYEVYSSGSGGPPGHSEYYPHRNDQVGNKLHQHGNIFESWGLNEIFPTESPGVLPAAAQAYSGYVDDSINALNKKQAAMAAQAHAHSAADNSNYNAYLSKLARLQALKQKNYQSGATAPTSISVQPASLLTSKRNSAAMFQNAIAPQTPSGVLLQQAVPVVPTKAAVPGPSPMDYDAFFSPILGKVIFFTLYYF
ncbi:hypothetical protein WDU94_002442 [Cyamophila willieti]